VLSRTPNTGTEGAELATEYFQSHSKFKQRCQTPHITNSSLHQGVGQGGHSNEAQDKNRKRSFNDVSNGMNIGQPKSVQTASNSQKNKQSIVDHGCGEAGHNRPHGSNKIKRMSPVTICSCLGKSDKKKAIVGGRINGYVCNNLLVETGFELTCVAKSLVDHGDYTGDYTGGTAVL